MELQGDVNTITELNENKELAEALSESNKMREILLGVLNKSDTMIYVTELHTDKIIFMTDYMKRFFGKEGDVVGQPCYKVLRDGLEKRCDFCPCYKLDEDPNSSVVWEETNAEHGWCVQHNDKYVDWHDGRKVHIQYAYELTDFKKAQAKLERNEEMLRVANKIAVSLLSKSNESYGEILTRETSVLTDYLGIDYFSVWRNTVKSGDMLTSMIYRWDRDSGGRTKPIPKLTGASFTRYAPNWEKIFNRNGTVNGPVSLISGREVDICDSFGLVSVFAAPVFVNNDFWGFAIFADKKKERFFDDESAVLMSAAAFLFTNAIIRSDMEREAGYRERTLQSINQAAACLLNSDTQSFEENLSRSMRIIGEAVKINRILIWKNYEEDGELYCRQIRRWPETEADKDSAAGFGFKYKNSIVGWKKPLSQGKCINGKVRDLPENERELLARHNIVSILVVPIFIEERFWGFVSFDDCRKERVFTEDEEALLRSGSLLLIHALNRNETMLKLHDVSVELKAAFENAAAASKAKSDFLSTMSHEMRTPMNAIIGMTAIGKKAADIAQKNYAIDRIGEASSHLLGVINDVLDMAKIEANKLELSSVEFNFEKMLQKTLTVIRFRAEEKKQTLTANIDGGIPHFLIGDDQRLAQIITNLLSNAVKFTPEGGTIRLEASLLDETDKDCRLRVEVTDNGIGISEKQQKKLFESFSQADGGISRKYGGTGLGLVISKHIVEMMGGKIWIESEFGKGSRFIFTVNAGRGSMTPHSLLAPSVDWKNVRILAVDKEENVRRKFTETFGRLGIACDAVSDGEEALRLVRERGGYGVYFIDFDMPEMNGAELMEKIKAECKNKASFVIMITELDHIAINECGFDRHLLKPLLSSAIIDCANDCLCVKSTAETRVNGKGCFAGKTILIAEDIEINREIIVSLLDKTDIETDCAENGEEALLMIQKAPEKYDIVFMDMQMPKMDGIEATRLIRALPPRSRGRLPIVAMTANVFKDDIETCIEAGMDDHLGKPIDTDKMFEKIRKYIGE